MAGLIGASAKTRRVKEFRASGTFTVPTGVKTVYLFQVGGGGGGDGSSTGGQGGNVIQMPYDVDGKASCAVVIGAGGTQGNAGGDTIFDGVVIAHGGEAGRGFLSGNPVSVASPTGTDGFGGSNGAISAAVAINGARLSPKANTGAGGVQTSGGASGYARVEWDE